MNVLSLFDGMGCGMISLKELGIPVTNYFASEIDKYAIQQTKLNFPEIQHLGSVTEVTAKDLPKIDLLIGGSPCQGFSFAGKQLNFEDERSKLFFEFVRIWKEVKQINPDAKFLLENVGMKKEYLAVISQHLEIFPVNINSNLVSAQNRNRWYWTNIKTRKEGLFGELVPDIPQPQDRGILLKDILQPESEIDEKYYLSNKMLSFLTKHKERHDNKGNGFGFKPKKITEKGNCLDTAEGSRATNNFICVAMQGGAIDTPGRKGQQLEPNTLRRLTPTECARLQTIPEWYRWKVSDTQQYRQLGNGWTVEVIKHIFSFLNVNHEQTAKIQAIPV